MGLHSDLVHFILAQWPWIFFYPAANPEADILLQKGDWIGALRKSSLFPGRASSLLCSILRAPVTNYHKLSGLKKKKKLILSPPWRLQVWKQGVSGVMILLKTPRKNPPGLFLTLGRSWQSLAFNVFELCSLFLVSASIFTWPSSPYVSLCCLVFL